MTNYTMPVLSAELKELMISKMQIRIRSLEGLKKRSELSSEQNHSLLAYQIALAALTANPDEYRLLRENGSVCIREDTIDAAHYAQRILPELLSIQPLYTAPPVPVKQEGEKCGKCKGEGWFADEMGMRRCFMCNDLVREGEHRD